MRKAQKERAKVSEKDEKILRILQKEGRKSFRQMGKECGLPESTVRFRVKRLEEEGVILGYKAILDPAKLGWETVASISINLVSKRYLDDVLQVIAGIEEVLFFSKIIGRHDIIAFAVCRDLQDLDSLVNDLSKVPGVEGTPRTNIWVSVRNWADWSLPLRKFFLRDRSHFH